MVKLQEDLGMEIREQTTQVLSAVQLLQATTSYLDNANFHYAVREAEEALLRAIKYLK